MHTKETQRGFASVLFLIIALIGVVSVVVYILLPKPSGVEYIKNLFVYPRPTPTPKPAPGCYYQQVECFTTPCDPILVCPTLTN